MSGTIACICFNLTAESASEITNAGVDGILVSAHGGRQIDCVPAPVGETVSLHLSFHKRQHRNYIGVRNKIGLCMNLIMIRMFIRHL